MNKQLVIDKEQVYLHISLNPAYKDMPIAIQKQTPNYSASSGFVLGRNNMSDESRPMEVIKHSLDCQCHRRREWIRKSMISGMLSSFR